MVQWLVDCGGEVFPGNSNYKHCFGLLAKVSELFGINREATGQCNPDGLEPLDNFNWDLNLIGQELGIFKYLAYSLQ